MSPSDCHTYFRYIYIYILSLHLRLLMSLSGCHTYFYYTFSTYTYGYWSHRQTVTPISAVLSLDTPTVISVTVRLSHLFLLCFFYVYLWSLVSHLFLLYFLCVCLRSLVSPSDCNTLISYTFVFLSFAPSPLLLVYPRFSSSTLPPFPSF